MNGVWYFLGMCFVVRQALFYLQAYCSCVTQSGIPWPSSDSPQHILYVGRRDLKRVTRKQNQKLSKNPRKYTKKSTLQYGHMNRYLIYQLIELSEISIIRFNLCLRNGSTVLLDIHQVYLDILLWIIKMYCLQSSQKLGVTISSKRFPSRYASLCVMCFSKSFDSVPYILIY